MKRSTTANEEVLEGKIREYLRTLPCCWFAKIHGGPYQHAGIPDFLGCNRGTFFGIEVKREDGKPTDMQKYHLERIGRAGGIGIYAYTLDDVSTHIN